jgi:AcrR family transcriptional regulator
MASTKDDLQRDSGDARGALLQAATALFGERGPASVSTREIAAAANVNSGLIHRHFRTKDRLLREVLNGLAREISQVEPSGPGDEMATLREFFFATRERTLYWKLLARCILDGRDPDEIQTDFPTVDRMVELLRDMQQKGTLSKEYDARNIAATVLALALGYLIFEPWILSATQLDEDVEGNALDGVRSRIFETSLAMIGSFK